MKFLVITKSKHPIPPEMTVPIADAMTAWANALTESGKIEAIWAFAGLAGGAGIANVDSLEELDGIMAGFPFGAFSDIEILPLVELNDSLQRLVTAQPDGAAQG